jgi:hypothetical protein
MARTMFLSSSFVVWRMVYNIMDSGITYHTRAQWKSGISGPKPSWLNGGKGFLTSMLSVKMDYKCKHFTDDGSIATPFGA